MVKIDLEGDGTKEGYVVEKATVFWNSVSNTVDHIHCRNYVQRCEDFVFLFNEIYRSLKPGGKAEIIAPYYTSMLAQQDPANLRTISEASFLCLQQKWRDSNKSAHMGLICDFEFEYQFAVHAEWQNRTQDALMFAIRHYWNVVKEINVTLTKI